MTGLMFSLSLDALNVLCSPCVGFGLPDWGRFFSDLFAIAEGAPETVPIARKPMPIGCCCTMVGLLSSVSINVFMSLSQPSMIAPWSSAVFGDDAGSANGTPRLGRYSLPLDPGFGDDHGSESSNPGKDISSGVFGGWLYKADGVAKPLLIGSLPLSSPRDRRETLAVVDIGVREPGFAKMGEWVW